MRAVLTLTPAMGRPRGLSRSPSASAFSTRETLVLHAIRLLNRVGKAASLGANRIKLARFVEAASLLYRDNPYHNWQHAVDVGHSIAWYVTRPVLAKALDSQDVFWLLVAALVHDLDHPGHSNDWEIKVRSSLAQKYDNSAVLERHSIEKAQALMEQEEFRFTDTMSDRTRARGQFLMQELILATDFSAHSQFMASLSAVREHLPRAVWSKDPQLVLLVLKALLKAADIGSTTKPYYQALLWATRVMQEFWAQGRMEKDQGLPVGAFNDESRISLREAQIKFIQFAALDLFRLMVRIDTEFHIPLQSLRENLSRYQLLQNFVAYPSCGSAALDCIESEPAMERRIG